MKYLTIVSNLNKEELDYAVISDFEFQAANVYSSIVKSFRRRGWNIKQLDDGAISVSPPSYERTDTSPKKVFIKSVIDEKVEFRLLEEVDGVFRKRRFSKRENAVRWVKNYFEERDFETEEREDRSGAWRLESPFDVTFVLMVGIMSETETDSRNRYAKILGVKNDASKDEVRRAYRKKSKQHHPDMGGDVDEFKKIQEAYENLSSAPHSNSKREFTPVGVCRAAEFYEGINGVDREIRGFSVPHGENNHTRAHNSQKNADGGNYILLGIILWAASFFMTCAAAFDPYIKQSISGALYPFFAGILFWWGVLAIYHGVEKIFTKN